MRLFTEFERTDCSAPRRSENPYDHLSRSADPKVARVRETMEDWFSSFPDEAKEELSSRLGTGGQRGFESAFHELFLHELMLRLGCSLEPHPELAESSKHPDFVVTSPTGGSSYLEAVVASELSDAELGADKAADDVLDGLDRLETPDFFVGVTVQAQGPRAISQGKLRRFVEAELSLLSPAALTSQIQNGGFDAVHRFQYEDEGWILDLVPIPKSQQAHAAGTRLIGIEMTRVKEIDTITPLKSALKKKGRKYGQLDRPYIIAVNAMDMFSDEPSMRAALFGTEDVSFAENQGTWEVRTRFSEGVWAGNSGPQYTRVSAVLYTRGINPGNLFGGARALLYVNPWAARPYQGELMQLPTVLQEGPNLVVRQGRSVAEVLDLTNPPSAS
jgi:hypothetical protein